MEHKEDYELSDTMQGKFLPFTSLSSGLFQTVAPGVHSFTIQIVNIAIIETISADLFLLIVACLVQKKQFFPCSMKNSGKMQSLKQFS